MHASTTKFRRPASNLAALILFWGYTQVSNACSITISIERQWKSLCYIQTLRICFCLGCLPSASKLHGIPRSRDRENESYLGGLACSSEREISSESRNSVPYCVSFGSIPGCKSLHFRHALKMLGVDPPSIVLFVFIQFPADIQTAIFNSADRHETHET
jgi:hypothetical protein